MSLSKPLTFFSLPLELRNMVYSKIKHDEDDEVLDKDMARGFWQPYALFQLSQTNSQIQFEIQRYLVRATVVFVTPDYGQDWSPRSPPAHTHPLRLFLNGLSESDRRRFLLRSIYVAIPPIALGKGAGEDLLQAVPEASDFTILSTSRMLPLKETRMLASALDELDSISDKISLWKGQKDQRDSWQKIHSVFPSIDRVVNDDRVEGYVSMAAYGWKVDQYGNGYGDGMDRLRRCVDIVSIPDSFRKELLESGHRASNITDTEFTEYCRIVRRSREATDAADAKL